MSKLFSHVLRKDSENSTADAVDASPGNPHSGRSLLAGVLSSRYSSKPQTIDSDQFPAFRAVAAPGSSDHAELDDAALPALFDIPKDDTDTGDADDTDAPAYTPAADEDVPDLFAGFGISDKEARAIASDSDEKAKKERVEPDVHEEELFDMIGRFEESNDDYRRRCDDNRGRASDAVIYDPYNTGFNSRGDDEDDIPTISLEEKYELQ